MPDLVAHLKKHGPSLSSDLVSWLAAYAKISKENAQKRLSRLVADQSISRLEHIRFKNNVGFIYLPDDFNSERFWRKLLSVLKAERSPIYSFIVTTISLGGIVTLQEMRMLSAHPDKLAGKASFSTFFTSVIETQIVNQIDARQGIYQINSNIYRNTDFNVFLSRQILTEFFLKGITEWFKINGLLYTRSIATITEGDKYFSHYKFSVFGLSYVLGSNLGARDAFVVVDYLPNERQLNPEEVDYFISKIESCRNSNKAIKFVPILVASYFTPSAFSELRAKNVLATTIKNLLGDKVAELLEELRGNLSSMVAEIKTDGTAFLEMVRKVNKTFGMTDNLRGKLFEYFIATVLYYDRHLEFEVGKLITDPKTFEKAELDIVMTNGTRAIHIVECKAYTSNIDDQDMEKFFVKARRATNWIRSSDQLRDADIFFYYYTLSDYEESALDVIKKNPKIEVSIKNGNDIRTMIRRYKEKDLSKTFEEFFN